MEKVNSKTLEYMYERNKSITDNRTTDVTAAKVVFISFLLSSATTGIIKRSKMPRAKIQPSCWILDSNGSIDAAI